MSAFRMLSAGAIERFSRETFYRMLLTVTRKKHPIESIRPSRGDALSYIKSLEQLKRQVNSLKRTKRRILYSADEIENIGRYFKVFFDDLEYLRDLKAYFDERILKYIVEISNQATLSILSRQRTRTGAGARSGTTSASGTWLPKLKTPNANKSKSSLEISAKKEMKNITHLVNTLRCLEIKWANVLREEDIDSENYEAETRKAMMKQRDRSCFELIWYLIPDLFAKASKAVKLSRQWVLKITSYYDILLSADIKKKTKEILAKIAEINQSIAVDEEKVKVLEVEMKRLSLKEHRHNLLTKDYNSTKEKIDRASSSYHKTQLEQKSLNRKLQDTNSLSTDEYNNLTTKLEQVKWKISTCQTELKIQKFNLSLLQQDLILEADMRSTFIRFQETVKEMLQGLNSKIEMKKETKRKLEKEIVLLKANNRKQQDLTKDGRLSGDVAAEKEEDNNGRNNQSDDADDDADDNDDDDNDYYYNDDDDDDDEDNEDYGDEEDDDVGDDIGDGEDSDYLDSESDVFVQISERLSEPRAFEHFNQNVYLYTNSAKSLKQNHKREVRYNDNVTVSKIPNDSDIFITMQHRNFESLTSYLNSKSHSSNSLQRKSRIPRLKVQ
ncbi:probable ATP-dependent helicase PF08_0048 [Octopus sinensis]|uniref:Probable ATP-dependent helicase PF08_0048 n=1 Tax=Octopus sinensis TaxID=2607531 RepID=A0A6P7SVF5_9MOLL|nr:probable ATP-dependent helicase PF08_0048 [Octopus sinensis]